MTLVFVLSLANTYSQRTLTGVITDESGESLIGANVVVKGEALGTVTDIDGAFTISVPEGSDMIVVSYTGYTTQEINVDGISTVSVVMTEGTVLDEIVVLGYSAVSRKDLTGSVSSIDATTLEDIQLPSIETALQGRAAGVLVNKNSGTPGGGIDVNIRGRTSITASNQPLYVIDGVPLINNDGNLNFTQEGVGNGGISVLSDLNPDEIESIEVLKDAATAAIYGSRGANGVVLITTKRGNEGSTDVTVNASYGVASVPKQIPVVSGPQYIEYITEVFGANIVGTEADVNWQDEIFKQAGIYEVNAGISGGSKSTKFYGGLGYKEEAGIIEGSGFSRLSGRLNVEHRASDKFNMGMNMGYTNSLTDRIQNDNNIYGALSAAVLLPPVVPIRNEDGSYGSAFGLENPVAATVEYDNKVDRSRLVGNVFAKYNILPSLSFRASLGTDILSLSERLFEPSVLQSSATGRAVVAGVDNKRFIHDYVLTYINDFGNNSLSLVAGTSFQEDKFNSFYSEAVDFPTDNFTGISSGASPTTTDGLFSGDNLKSYFGSAGYNFADKYIINATVRADGSSRFVNNQWGIFPGVSAAWNIANEDFFNKEGSISGLKLRLSYGQTGNNNVGNFASRQLYGGGANYLDSPGIVPTQLGNPDLKWETTTQTVVGLDLGFLSDRILVTADYYIKDTDDLLLNRPIPTTSGFTTVLQNVGSVKNTGVDLGITTVNIDNKDLSWSTTFTLGYLKNEVTSLVDDIPFDAGFANRIAVGQSLGSFFGYQTDGIFQNDAEIEAAATQPNAAPGDIRFKDISGGPGEDGILGTDDDLAPDGVINDNDRTYLGKFLPDFSGGLNNSLKYKGFNFDFFFQFSTGFQIYNNNNVFAEGLNSVFAPTVNAWENRWQQEGDQTDVPRLVRNDPNGNRRDSDRFAEDGDYIRLKSLTLGYSLPKTATSKIGLSRLNVYVSGYNLWTATNYSWFDPEVNTFDGSNTALGTDFLTFPQSRILTFGVKAQF